MRWLKHMTATRRDEKIAAYMDDCGKDAIEGYGFWWLLLEVIAEQMTKDDMKCSATYSLPQWSHHLYSHHHRVGKYLGKLEGNGLVTLEKHEGKITVTIPNLLKYRDEYTRKSGQVSGQPPDNIPPRTDTEAETDREQNKRSTASPISSIMQEVCSG